MTVPLHGGGLPGEGQRIPAGGGSALPLSSPASQLWPHIFHSFSRFLDPKQTSPERQSRIKQGSNKTPKAPFSPLKLE